MKFIEFHGKEIELLRYDGGCGHDHLVWKEDGEVVGYFHISSGGDRCSFYPYSSRIGTPYKETLEEEVHIEIPCYKVALIHSFKIMKKTI